MSEEYKYRYLVTYKYRYTNDPKLNTERIYGFVTGYVPRTKMADLQKYIQGRAEDKKIIGLHKLTQRSYYEDIEPVGPNGEIDIE